MKIFDKAKGAIKNFAFHKFGKCNICGKPTLFVCLDVEMARNNMYCVFCHSSSRKRHVAKMILDEVVKEAPSISCIPKKQNIRIYSTDTNDAFYKVLRNYDSYISSSFLPDVQPGFQLQKQVFCQNLENLKFDDEAFDIVITEDVFEHVRDYKKGFCEVNRVLRPGGYHIFTIPCYFDRSTLIRVDTSTHEDLHLLPPEYHGDKIRGKILAYRTFGIDIFDLLQSIGFHVKVNFSSYLDQKVGIFDSYVFVTKKFSQPENCPVTQVDFNCYQLQQNLGQSSSSLQGQLRFIK